MDPTYETDNAPGAREGAEAPTGAAAEGGTATTQQDSRSRPAPYTHAGAAFTDWFNDKVRQLVNPTIKLGTKTASVVRLHPDGRLECSLHGDGEEGQTFVAFEGHYLDQLVRRIGAIGL